MGASQHRNRQWYYTLLIGKTLQAMNLFSLHVSLRRLEHSGEDNCYKDSAGKHHVSAGKQIQLETMGK